MSNARFASLRSAKFSTIASEASSIPGQHIDVDTHAAPAVEPDPDRAGAVPLRLRATHKKKRKRGDGGAAYRAARLVRENKIWDGMFNQLIEFIKEHKVSHSMIVDVHSTCMCFLYSQFCRHTAL